MAEKKKLSQMVLNKSFMYLTGLFLFCLIRLGMSGSLIFMSASLAEGDRNKA